MLRIVSNTESMLLRANGCCYDHVPGCQVHASLRIQDADHRGIDVRYTGTEDKTGQLIPSYSHKDSDPYGLGLGAGSSELQEKYF